MKIKNFLVKIMVMLVIFTTFSYKTNEIKINNSKEQIVENFNKTIKKANNTQDELSEEDLEMFTSAFENVKINLSEYLDITGLNVENKESITLPNYNINYIAPTYTEAYSDIHSDMISSLSKTIFFAFLNSVYERLGGSPIKTLDYNRRIEGF